MALVFFNIRRARVEDLVDISWFERQGGIKEGAARTIC